MAVKAIRFGLCHAHINEPSQKLRPTLEIDDLVAGRMSRQILGRTCALSLDEDAHDAPDVSLVNLSLNPLLETFKREEALGLFRLVHIVREPRGGRPLPLGVLEDVEAIILTALD